LHNIRISPSETEELQENLVKSHACGAGEPVPEKVIRLMLLLKIQSLAAGHSGVRVALVDRLITFFNEGIHPVIFQQGSLGASGDLAPLAHLSLPLLGLGEVYWQGQRRPSQEVLQALGLSPLRLQAKEGLALLNGTQFSTAYGVWALLRGSRLLRFASLVSALSADVFDCHRSPFDERIHQLRPHPGQLRVARQLRELRRDSILAKSHKTHVQDPYAFRCIPQVHGASWDAAAHVEQVITTELNAVTDNPNIFPKSDAILSGGNFHAQPVALVLDYLAIALAELGNISERRTYQLISGQRGLPAFLTPKAGLHSGLMIPQYTAASIVSQNKQLCTPASVDSIVSSNGQEDHVSMAANAGTKLYRIARNVTTILAIEWFTAAQALEFRRPLRSSTILENLINEYRQRVPALQGDRVFHDDIRITIEFLETLAYEKITALA
jgi:histidine ammonia-lyase